jgi:hypothetical protein
MKPLKSTRLYNNIAKLTGGLREAKKFHPTTPSPTNKADIYATPEKYTQVRMDIYASLEELHKQGCYKPF